MTGSQPWTRHVFNLSSVLFQALSVKSRVILTTHAAYESGYGVAWAAKNCNNIFNITTCSGKPTCRDGWRGEFRDQADADWEFRIVDGKQVKVRIPQRWRYYGSVPDSLKDYWSFIGATRYVAARNALVNSDLDTFVKQLRLGTYFTLPVDNYWEGGKLKEGYLLAMKRVMAEVAGYLAVSV